MASRRLAWLDAPLRLLAALLGTLPVAVLAGACLARFVSLPEDARFILGFTLVIPLWVTAMCFAFLSRSAVRVWVVCAVLGAMLGALAYGVPQ
jgi:hypothetical protein